jgi:ribonucleoside-triphosphate reductase (formate)
MGAGYTVTLTYEDDFVNLLENIHNKYANSLFHIQGIANRNLDINSFSKSFFKKSANANTANVSSDPNSNVNGLTIDQWTHEFGKGMQKLNSIYLAWDELKKLYGKEDADDIIESTLTGSIFINDLHQFDRPYCFGFDLAPLCMDGLKFFNRLDIGPPKRADSFIDLVIQSTAYLSNQIAGATSFPTFFVNLDWYLRNDYGDNYADDMVEEVFKKKITNLFQKLIYSWGWPFRGSQSPFTNVSIYDKSFMSALFGPNEDGAPKYVNPDGTTPDLDSIYILQKAFYEYFDKIFATEQIFTFPIVTLAIALDKEGNYADPEFVDWVCSVYADKCLANIYIGEPNSFSSCCRMKNDFEKLYQNSFGVGGISIGSTRVSGINLPRIAFEMKKNNDLNFAPYLKYELDKCHKILRAHRELLKDRIARDNFPLYNAGWISLDKQYNTLGFIGAYEFLDILGKDIVSDDGVNYLIEILKFMEDSTQSWQIEDGISYNIEQIPGESMAVRLSQLDKLLGYNEDYDVDIYSNQYVPLIKEASIADRFKVQGKLDSLTSGGSILHLNIHDGAQMTSKQVFKLMETARKTHTVYWAVNRVFCKCENDHFAISNNGSCPECGGKITSQYTRVVGFCVPVDSWHQARQDEFNDRVFYSNNTLMAFA